MMLSRLVELFEKYRHQVIADCTKCGFCYQRCSLNEYTLKDLSLRDVQDRVLNFLKEGVEDKVVYERGFSCLQCFKCVNNHCPKGLNPLLTNELIKWDYRQRDIKILRYDAPWDRESPQRILSSIQIPKDEREKITFKVKQKKAKYVFFPGCNVYFQPEKILNALDIMNLITNDYAFLPGLDHCCGNTSLFYGDVIEAERAMQEFIKELSTYKPEVVILWCPTCLCRFDTTIAKIFNLPFKVISFPQFVAKNIGKLEFKHPIKKRITLHEACKSAFTGLDLNGIRDILKNLPEVELVEMQRHGENTVCCGVGAQSYSEELADSMRDERLREVCETQAEVLVDVCHACHQLFVGMEQEYGYQIENYVNLLAKALGIERKDKLKEYIQQNNLNRILSDAENNIIESAYSNEEIKKAIKENILK